MQQREKSRSTFKVPDVNSFTGLLSSISEGTMRNVRPFAVRFPRRPAVVCRVIHSAVLQLSCVQVINKVVGLAYLIRQNVLPKRGQVRKPDKCCTLDLQEGERAMLIRGSKDWGICIGKWQGVVKGVPGVPGVSGTKGTPGTSETPAIKGVPGIKGKPGTKGQPGSLSVKFFSLTEKQEWKRVEKCGISFPYIFWERGRSLMLT